MSRSGHDMHSHCEALRNIHTALQCNAFQVPYFRPRSRLSLTRACTTKEPTPRPRDHARVTTGSHEREPTPVGNLWDKPAA